MAQMGFFDLSDRYASLDAKKDPLVEIDAVVPWEEFRPALERVWRKPDEARKSRAGCQADGRGADVEDAGPQRALQPFRRPDRVSGPRPAVLHAVSGVGPWGPGARRQDGMALSRCAGCRAGKVEELFGQFDGHLARQGYIAQGGQILDASIVPVRCPHNTRNENTAIKRGEVPEDWADKPAKRCQKDLDARWSEADQKTVRGAVFPTNKHGKSH